jgi:hypothetical protein
MKYILFFITHSTLNHENCVRKLRKNTIKTTLFMLIIKITIKINKLKRNIHEEGH